MVRCVAVAVSGGRDSLALLHAAARAGAEIGVEVHALHVNHGLMPDAERWASHVQALCERWARKGWPLHFAQARLTTRPAAGDSVEAWARRERYKALSEMARAAGVSLVLLGHHRRDQAETFLLQALRGAGPAGLAAMPARAERDGLTWARPWLAQPREAIEAYVRRHRIAFVDDPSNADSVPARSRLRLQVMAPLVAAFPQAEAVLADAAARAAEARAVLDEVAGGDLAAVCEGDALRLAAWAALSLPRRRNALRAWLRRATGQGAPQTAIDRLLVELPQAGPASWQVAGVTLRRHRGRLRTAPRAAAPAGPPPGVCRLHIAGPGNHAVPDWGGALHVELVAYGGVALAGLQGCELRVRSGGERFQRAPGTPPRSLKKQFQSAGLAAWARDAPLLYAADGRLLFVPGLGLDARALAAPHEVQVRLDWARL